MAKGGATEGISPVGDSRLWDDECLDFASAVGGVYRACEGPCVSKVPSEKVMQEGPREAIDVNPPLCITSGAIDVERAQEALHMAQRVRALEAGARVCVNFESGKSTESKEKYHQPACLLGAKDQPSEVVNVSGGANVEGVGECFNDRVVANAPKAR